MQTQLKIAIIGAGIGREHLRAYLKLTSQFKVVYLCDIDTQRAHEVVSSEGADRDSVLVTDDFESILVDKTIDIVDICLPPHLHLLMSKMALKAGKHVICEKPLVASLKEADELQIAAQQAGRHVFPVFQYRFGPAITKLQKLIKHGFAGKPLVASIETHWNRETDYYENPWRGTWKGEQGGAVLGHAIHNHDLLCSIMGPIKKLSAFGATRVNDIETEDCTAISFQMESGALATSSITLGAYTDTTRLRFCFENLTAESDLLPYSPADGAWTFSARGTKHSQSQIDDFLTQLPSSKIGFIGYLKAVYDYIVSNCGQAITLEDGRRSIELVTAIYHSMRTCSVVELPLDHLHPLYGGWQPS